MTVAPQIAIHGSKEPAVQTNNVDMQSESDALKHYHEYCYTTLCRSRWSKHDSSHFVGGGKDDQTKVSGPTIGVPVHVPVDVYSPAHDRDFLGGL